jgi:hypothetical protein
LEEVFCAAEFGIGELEFEGLALEVNSPGLVFLAPDAGENGGELAVRLIAFEFTARFSHILGRGPNVLLALLALLAISFCLSIRPRSVFDLRGFELCPSALTSTRC